MSSKKRPYIGPSDAQANAEALYRRGAPYTAASEQSFAIAWDHHRREPKDLREAVYFVRRAYADEVPYELHEGADAIDEGGTPKFTGLASSYLFGSPYADDRPRPKCECDGVAVATDRERPTPLHFEECPVHPSHEPLMSYYLTPFRAALQTLLTATDSEQRRGRIIQHITVGQMSPWNAAVKEKAHPDDAKLVAEDALRSFLRSLSDIKVHIRRAQDTLRENETAA